MVHQGNEVFYSSVRNVQNISGAFRDIRMILIEYSEKDMAAFTTQQERKKLYMTRIKMNRY